MTTNSLNLEQDYDDYTTQTLDNTTPQASSTNADSSSDDDGANVCEEGISELKKIRGTYKNE